MKWTVWNASIGGEGDGEMIFEFQGAVEWDGVVDADGEDGGCEVDEAVSGLERVSLVEVVEV